MDGKYLASNIGPLKVIGDGKVFIAINDLLNSNRFEKVELVAYSIRGSEGRIVTIECLFRNKQRETFYYRSFDFYRETGNIDDDLRLTADYGIGFCDYELTLFMQLRDFYLQNIEVKA